MRLRFSLRLNTIPTALTTAILNTFLTGLRLSQHTFQSPCRIGTAGSNPGFQANERHLSSDSRVFGVFALSRALHKCNTPRGALASIARCDRWQRIRSAAWSWLRPRRFWLLGSVLTTVLAVCVGDVRADRPTSAETFQVYQTLESWLRTNSIPERTSPREQRAIDPRNCTGAAVVLRLSGTVIGRAEVISENRTAVWEAATEAWKAAYPRLIDGIPNDALYEDRLRDRLARMTIDLQLSGSLVPLTAETYSGAAILVNPGRQGVAARVGERFSAVFPSAILTFQSTAEASFDPSERALRIAVTRLGLLPVDLAVIRRSDPVTLYRFDVVHLAQIKPGLPPSFLVRGGRLVSDAAVNTANLKQAADSAAEYLIQLEWPGEEPLGMLGDYRASANRFDPYISGPREQAMAAFALARYGASGSTAPARSAHASSFAAHVLDELTRVVGEEVDPRMDPAALASWVMAWAQIESMGAVIEPLKRDHLARYASGAVEHLLGEQATQSLERLGPGALALRAYALARASDALEGDFAERARDLARSEVRRLFREVPAAQLISAMPWLGWAEIHLASNAERIPSDIALRELRETVWDFQVDAISAGVEDADFVGGIVFARGSTQLPTWQSLRAVALMTSMLGDERLTDQDELFRQITPLIRSLRFLMQLSVSDAEGHMYPAPSRAIGGLRLSTWDQTVSVDATSLGLLVLVEMLDALAKRSE